MPVTSAKFKAIALLSCCAVAAMALATGLPYWLMISVDNTDTNVGLWQVCGEDQSGHHCADLEADDLPDEHASQLKACRAGTIISILFSALVAVIAIIGINRPPQSTAGAKKLLAVPTLLALLAAIVTLAVYCGFLWPWMVDNLKQSARYSWSYNAGAAFYFCCVSAVSLFIVLIFVAKIRTEDDLVVNEGMYARMGEPAYQPYPAAGYAAYPHQGYSQGSQQGYAPAPVAQYTY